MVRGKEEGKWEVQGNQKGLIAKFALLVWPIEKFSLDLQVGIFPPNETTKKR